MQHDVASIVRSLGRPDEGVWSTNRRQFLQLAATTVAGAVATAALPGWTRTAASAAVPTPGDGILVVVNLHGGNDAWNTVVPYATAAYHDRRGPLAIATGDVLRLDDEVGLHPALGFLHQRWLGGQLAIVQGVGDPDPDLSHFTSMARWMSATDGASPRTGWLGRYLDGVAGDSPFVGVTIGPTVPLTLVGYQSDACAIGEVGGSFGTSLDVNDQRLARAVRDLAAGPQDRGALADAVARAGRAMVDVNTVTAPLYTGDLPTERPARDLTLAARLINAGLGVRVINVDLGSFDTHATQLGYHAGLLRRLDAGLAAFFGVLSPDVAGRVVVYVASEFGRALTSNDSGGTDHGAAGAALLIGANVRGGRHGALPSFADQSVGTVLSATVEHRSVFATVLARWLAADDVAILGRSFEQLDLFVAPPSPGSGTTDIVTRLAGDGFVEPVRPVRVLDTRDGTGGVAGPVGAGQTIDVMIAGDAVPPTATGVVLNLTATETTARSYVTVWPAGRERPLASCLNMAPGQTVPNLVLTALGANGAVSLYNSAGTTHLVADVVAYVGPAPGATFLPLDPFRLLDTRTGAPLSADEPRRVSVAGRGSVPASGVVGVVANVTVTEPTESGYLTVWPAAQSRPVASNLNFLPGQTVPNLAVARLADGAIDLVVSSGSAHVVIDVVGVLTDASSGARLHTMVPARVLDTREGLGAAGRLVPMEAIELVLGGVVGVPGDAMAVALNLTAADPSSFGWITVWPAGQTRPETSSLNLSPGRDVANLVITRLGRDGAIGLYNARGSTDLVADVVGWFA